MWSARRTLFLTFTDTGLASCIASRAGQWEFFSHIVTVVALAFMGSWSLWVNKDQNTTSSTSSTIFIRWTTASKTALLTVPWNTFTIGQVSIFEAGVTVGVLWSVAGLAGLVASVFLACEWVFVLRVVVFRANAGITTNFSIMEFFSVISTCCTIEITGTSTVGADLTAFNTHSFDQFLAWSAFCALVVSFTRAFHTGSIAMVTFPWIFGIEVGS